MDVEGKIALMAMHLGVGKGAVGEAQQWVREAEQHYGVGEGNLAKQLGVGQVAIEFAGQQLEELRQQVVDLRAQLEAADQKSLDGSRSVQPAAQYYHQAPAAATQQQAEEPRKAVCTYCWQTSSRCDSESWCSTCYDKSVPCVYKRCAGGDQCQRRACPRLHPGQWDEMSVSWSVEEGRMPEQGVEPESVKDRP